MSHNIMSRSIVLAFILMASPACAQSNPAPAAGNNAATVNTNTLTPDQAKRALDTLQDDTKRAQMIDTLRAIANATPANVAPANANATTADAAPAATQAPAAAPAPEAAASPLSADSLGAQLLLTMSEQIGDFSHQVADVARTLTHFPAFYHWIVRTANDPTTTDQLLDIAWKLAVVFGGAFAAEWLVFWIVKRPVSFLETHLSRDERLPARALAPVSDIADPPSSAADVGAEPEMRRRRLSLARTWQSLLRLPFVLGRLVLELLPVLVFVGVATALLSTELGNLWTTRSVIFAVVNAYAIARGMICIARALAGPFGLIRVRAETGAYIEIWARRIVMVGVTGVAMANVAQLLGLHRGGYLALLRLVMLVVHLFIVVIILQCRRQVASAIRAPAGRTGAAAMARNRIAGLWHYLAIAVDIALWAVWALNIRNGYSLLLQYFVGTIAVVLVTRLATMVVLSLIDRGFRISPDILQRFPGLEARANRYLPLLRRIVSTTIGVIGFVALLEVWGVDAIVWFYGGQIGSRLLSAVVTIGDRGARGCRDLGGQQRAAGSPAHHAVARGPLRPRRAAADLSADAAHGVAVRDPDRGRPDGAERNRRQCRAAAGGRRYRRHRDWFRFAEAGAGFDHRAVSAARKHRAGRRQRQCVRPVGYGRERLDPHHPAARRRRRRTHCAVQRGDHHHQFEPWPG